MERKVILIDVDDVICENHFWELANAYLKKIGRPELKSLDIFNIPNYEDFFLDSSTETEKFYNFFAQHDSYKGVKPLPGAIEALKTLIQNHEVYLLTNSVDDKRPRLLARQFTDKFNWILDNLPFFPHQNIIFARKKHIFKADVIIDDRIGNLKGDYPMKLLFTSYHNKNITQKELKDEGAIRVSSWNEILKILF